jgi:hypothetical protein
MDIEEVTKAVLSKYDVVLVGGIDLSSAKVTLLTDWTNAGGTLITFSPDATNLPVYLFDCCPPGRLLISNVN